MADKLVTTKEGLEATWKALLFEFHGSTKEWEATLATSAWVFGSFLRKGNFSAKCNACLSQVIADPRNDVLSGQTQESASITQLVPQHTITIVGTTKKYILRSHSLSCVILTSMSRKSLLPLCQPSYGDFDISRNTGSDLIIRGTSLHISSKTKSSNTLANNQPLVC